MTPAERLNKMLGINNVGPKATLRDQVLTLAKARNEIRNLPQTAAAAFLDFALQHAHLSGSQIFQDLFVVFALGHDHKGQFVEFGATDGVEHSNSYSLATRFGWTGLCAEPARGWHEAFRQNRPETRLDTRCVWSHDNQSLTFSEAKIGALSTLADFKNQDGNRRKRRDSTEYQVETVSLTTLLAEHDLPPDLDYLSVDTEGSEFEILSHLDFSRFRPKILTVEHNFTPARNKVLNLLKSNGYRRVLSEVSMFDDWFITDGIADHIPACGRG